MNIDLDLGKIIESLAGNGVLGIVLAWFMVQHTHLVKALMITIEKATEAVQKSNDTSESVRNVIEKCNRK